MLSFETEDSDLMNSLLYKIGCVIDTPYFYLVAVEQSFVSYSFSTSSTERPRETEMIATGTPFSLSAFALL